MPSFLMNFIFLVKSLQDVILHNFFSIEADLVKNQCERQKGNDFCTNCQVVTSINIKIAILTKSNQQLILLNFGKTQGFRREMLTSEEFVWSGSQVQHFSNVYMPRYLLSWFHSSKINTIDLRQGTGWLFQPPLPPTT